MDETPPEGYHEISNAAATAVVHESLKDDFAAALSAGTMYDYGRSRPDALAFQGRGPAFAFQAPLSGEMLLVRRSRHGGLLAPLTGELFKGEGRAPQELRTSLALKQRGIATPAVLGYVVYPVAQFFCKVDVVVRFIPNSSDLVSYLSANSDTHLRAAAMHAAHVLLLSLAEARVVHPDLNLRNVLIAKEGEKLSAWLLDVDTVKFNAASRDDAMFANLGRFARSFFKLRRRGLVDFEHSQQALLNVQARRH